MAKKTTKKVVLKKAPLSKDEALLKALHAYTDGVTDRRGEVIEPGNTAREIEHKASELATLLENRIAASEAEDE